jgi:hypothetical protein
MLVPTIGLVQVGSQAMADRYSYLPQIGLLIAIVWAVGGWIEHHCPSVAPRRFSPASSRAR